MGRKLKVFQARLGFHDSVVAAPSQAAALRAWGVRQNLFASGDAKVTTEEAAVKAATAHPGMPLRRALGSAEEFALEPAGLPKVPNVPKTPKAKQAVGRKPAPMRPSADRGRLNAAEKALDALEDRRKRDEIDLHREQKELAERISEARNTYVAARGTATAKVVEARKAYREAGGKD